MPIKRLLLSFMTMPFFFSRIAWFFKRKHVLEVSDFDQCMPRGFPSFHQGLDQTAFVSYQAGCILFAFYRTIVEVFGFRVLSINACIQLQPRDIVSLFIMNGL